MNDGISSEPVMSAADALGIARRFDRAGIRIWLNGGWSIDALVGRQTRPHRDLDLFVERENVDALRALLGEDEYAEMPGGRAANFVLADGRDHEVDVHVFALDGEGNGLYPNEDGTTWVCPARGLAGSGTILGEPVRCFTPELELQCHSGYELDDDDLRDVAALHNAFPGIEPLPVVIVEQASPQRAGDRATVSDDRSLALVAGLLFLLSAGAGLVSIAPSVDSDDYLARVADHRAEVLRSAIAQAFMGLTYVGIATSLYPALDQHGENLALGFAGLRVLAGFLLFAGIVPLVRLLPLSRAYVSSCANRQRIEQPGTRLRARRRLLNHGAMVMAVAVGSVPLNLLIFREALVPRWMAGWGLLGSGMAVVASLGILLRLTGERSRAYAFLILPLAAQEVVFAVWLIARGLSEASVSST